ncbi:extracellular solute-binding protein [Streptomyces sp. V3I7]|uniref:extracellular solute-binding protein n=1 Tax=Streptomyces sp. V3I7 TaxID=3042278 RepID=UPI002787177C|nr:extracellular solute-binding protein [Streptomyces sp. V3I7]MDQ0994702.1 alpha-glucoside transport system substrate-binding protein [Streptomyces sp. V3I7]
MIRMLRAALVLALLLAVAGCGGGPRHGRVTIMVPWSGQEFAAFYTVLRQFELSSGIDVDVQVTRAQTQQLDAAVSADAPPDLAVLPSPAAVTHYAETGAAKALKGVSTRAFLQPFRGLATGENGGVYALPVKADVKSLVWYDSERTPRTPRTYASLPGLLLALGDKGRTWCLGLESGPTSGWPGADWIADLLLARPGGTRAYEDWLTKDRAWTSDAVRKSWTAWHDLVRDSTKSAATQGPSEAAHGMTASPPKCALAHGARSALGLEGARYRFVPSSPTRALEVSADFIGKFTDDNDQSAMALLRYLAGAAAQRLWVEQQGGSALSPNGQVSPGEYTDAARQGIAKMLRPEAGYTLCFSAADAMEADVSAAFYRAVLDYSADPGLLGTLLKNLDVVQGKLHGSPVPRAKLCSIPS